MSKLTDLAADGFTGRRGFLRGGDMAVTRITKAVTRKYKNPQFQWFMWLGDLDSNQD